MSRTKTAKFDEETKERLIQEVKNSEANVKSCGGWLVKDGLDCVNVYRLDERVGKRFDVVPQEDR